MISTNATVIENFYADPDSVRRVATRLPYVELPTFPKLYQSNCNLASQQAITALSAHVGHEIQYDQDNRTFGVFRAAMLADNNQFNVHVDLHDWAAVLHLSPTDQSPTTGTGFFRHRPTGLFGPPDGEPVNSDLMTRIYADGKDPALWELYEFVESKFNSMVVFRGSRVFHDTVGRFGDKLENCRLTQNFFFSLAEVD
jgi:hypothetical protein